MPKYTEKELLHLAGKLAIAARLVVTSDALTISESVKGLEKALNEYDHAIFNNLEKGEGEA